MISTLENILSGNQCNRTMVFMPAFPEYFIHNLWQVLIASFFKSIKCAQIHVYTSSL